MNKIIFTILTAIPIVSFADVVPLMPRLQSGDALWLVLLMVILAACFFLMTALSIYFIERYRKLKVRLAEEANVCKKSRKKGVFLLFWVGVFMTYVVVLSIFAADFILAGYMTGFHNETFCKMGLCSEHDWVNCNKCGTKHLSANVWYCSQEKKCFPESHTCFFCTYHKKFHVLHRYVYRHRRHWHKNCVKYSWGISKDCIATCPTCGYYVNKLYLNRELPYQADINDGDRCVCGNYRDNDSIQHW